VFFPGIEKWNYVIFFEKYLEHILSIFIFVGGALTDILTRGDSVKATL
jgi:hypothetical protein